MSTVIFAVLEDVVDNAFEPIVHPPIVPVVALISPVTTALFIVTLPLVSTMKLPLMVV